MVSTVALLAALVVVLCASVALWRASRRVLTVSQLKNISVSRQWLLQHQGSEER
jgi:hypothetical protein